MCFIEPEDGNLVRVRGVRGGSNGAAIRTLTVMPQVVTGATAAQALVTLSAAAGGGGALVTLSSDSPAVTVPASVLVAEGSTTAAFDIATTAVVGPVQAVIAATYNGTAAFTLTVAPPDVAALTLTPESVQGSDTSVATVILSGPAPEQSILVFLASSHPSIAAVPATVTIPAGSTQVSAGISTVAVAEDTNVTISVSRNGETRNAALLVRAANAIVITALNADHPSPQRIGTWVQWTATVTGGPPPLEFEFARRMSPGGSWTVARPWSTDPTWSSTVDGAGAGTYEIRVAARTLGSSQDAATRTATFEWVLGPQATLDAVVTDKPSPQKAGTAVTVTAQASGGTGLSSTTSAGAPYPTVLGTSCRGGARAPAGNGPHLPAK
jgi:hypothetical protein